MKTGIEWAKEYGVLILDADGFGERSKDMPLTTDLMTEADFNKGIGTSSCKFYNIDLFRSKLSATGTADVVGIAEYYGIK